MDLFNALKRSHSPYIPLRQSSTILFQLYFDEEKQACLKVIDKKGKDCEVDYRSYQGEQRAVLKALHKINDNNSMVIDWENDSEHLYLAENDFLVYHLKNCNNLVDSQLNPIFFTDEKAIVGLSIKQIENSPNLKSQVFIECQGQTIENGKIITESYLLADKVIYEVLPLGDNYNALSLLETEIDKIDLEKYFSLIYSSFDNLSIRYLDFQEKENLPLNTNPTLIFEKIDEDQSLYIRVTLSASNMEASFLTNYDITHVVNINELEHTLLVSELSGPDYDPQANIRQLLNKHKRKLKAKGNNDYFEDNDLFILEEEIAQAFIYQDLPDLIQTYEVLGAEKLKSYKIRAIKPKLNLSLGHGIDFLEGDAQLDMAGEKLNLFDAIGQYRKQSYITLSDGTHALVNPAYMKKLERLFKKKKDNVAVSFFDLPLVEELIDDKVADKTFKKTRKIFEGFNTLHKKRSKLPPVKAKLRDYQKQGYHWLSYLQKHQLGGCLADDMGLGKTLQAITLLASLYPKESLPTLVVMPKSLIFNWTQIGRAHV